MHTHDYLQARATIKTNRYKADNAAVGMYVCIYKVHHRPESLHVPTEVNTL